MIRKLRIKFVIVTMCLITVTFGTILIADYAYSKYWEKETVSALLLDFAKSDVKNSKELDDIVSKNLFYDEVFLIQFDKNQTVTKIQSPNDSNLRLSNQVLEKLLASGDEKHTYHSYMYAIAEKDGGYQMAITDVFSAKVDIQQYVGTILLYAGGFLILLMVSILLSRFVIKPAQIALDREKRFISDASHELKTPLSAISINAQVLEEELGDNKHLQNILSESKRMEALIKNLLRLSSLDEGKQPVERKLFNISNCCEELVLSMESVCFEKKQMLQYEIEGGMYFTGAEASIKQVLVILLDNAMKHTPEKGQIEVRALRKGRKIILAVENTGEGIPEQDLPHIFERFYRVDKSRASEENSNYGLGLAIAKGIVEEQGGTIHASSECGKSTCFTVEFTNR